MSRTGYLARMFRPRDPSLYLVPNGPELFLPLLDANTCHVITIEGVYEYLSWFSWCAADAKYDRDIQGCFTKPYQFSTGDWPRLTRDTGKGVRLGGERKPFTAQGEDREAHRYTYVLCVGEEPLNTSLSLVSPGGGGGRGARGKLTVSIRQVTKQEAALFAPKPDGSLVVRTAGSVQPEDNAQRQQWVEKQIRRYEHSTSYTDETFLRDLAASTTAALLAKREEIHAEWERFNSDPKAITLLRSLSPVTYERAQAMPRALALAEEIAVKRVPPPPRPTDEEIRAKNVRLALRRIKDETALIDALTTAGVPEDERDMYLSEFRRKQVERDERRQNRGGGTDVILR